MPLIHITTSAEHPDAAASSRLLDTLSRTLARHFNKPERWVMTCLAPQAHMTFASSDAPACYVEVKNIGTLQPPQSAALSRDLCEQLSTALHVDADRIYIEFTDAIGHLWGWNGDTFG